MSTLLVRLVGLVTAAIGLVGAAPSATVPARPGSVTDHSVTATATSSRTMLGGQLWNTRVDLTTTGQTAVLRITESYHRYDGGAWAGGPYRLTEVTSGFAYTVDAVHLAAASVTGTDLLGTQCALTSSGARTGCGPVTLSIDMSWTAQGPPVTSTTTHRETVGCYVTTHHVTTITRDATGSGVVQAPVDLGWGFGSYRLIDTTDAQSMTCLARPTAPRAVVASPRTRAAAVTWSAPAVDGGGTIIRYVVTAAPGGRTCVASGSSRSCTVTGLSTGTSYRFTVRAANLARTGPASTASAPIVVGAPTRPRSFSVGQLRRGVAKAAWARPALVNSGPVTAYRVRWSYDRGASWTPWIDRWRQHSATRTHLIAGRAYVVQVRAVNRAGAGAVATRRFVQRR